MPTPSHANGGLQSTGGPNAYHCVILQVQGLMEIFQREWCNIYMWTVNGSAMFHIPRDRQYWTACFEVLSEYWWAHLVPAKHAIASNKKEDAYRFMCAALPAAQMCHTEEPIHIQSHNF